jgi:hypothetical protein
VEIINNEVISAGRDLKNTNNVVLVHCRVSGQQLDFTVRCK